MSSPRSTRRAPRAVGHVPGPVADHLADEPLRAVDVGAARGICPHWLPFLEYLRVEAFEPDAAECARLAARSHPHIRWHPVALAGQPGPRDLHVLATPTGSSFFPLDPGFVDRFGFPDYHREVEVLTLDCVSLGDHLADLGAGGPHLLKLDTQGSELEILSGLRPEQYDDVLGVELESELSPAYVGQPLFPEVHAELEGRGLALLDLRVQRVHLTAGIERAHYLQRHLSTAIGSPDLTAQAHAVDAVYVRPLTTMVDCADADTLRRYLTVLQAYRYHDGIFWLLDQPPVQATLGASVIATLVDAYARSAPRPGLLRRTGRVPHLLRRARRATSYALERVTGRDGFDPPRRGWTHLYWPDS